MLTHENLSNFMTAQGGRINFTQYQLAHSEIQANLASDADYAKALKILRNRLEQEFFIPSLDEQLGDV